MPEQELHGAQVGVGPEEVARSHNWGSEELLRSIPVLPDGTDVSRIAGDGVLIT